MEIAVPPASINAIEAGFGAIRHVHDRMSFHSDGSDLALLRNAAAGETIRVDCGTIAVLAIAANLHEATGGLFDITIGRALVRHGFLPRPPEELDCFDGGATDIVLIDDRHVRCDRRVLIDLGGIAKGFAVDRAVEALIAAGASRGIVNAGGDIRVFGAVDHIVHIRSGHGSLDRVISLRDGAVASSSNVDTRHQDGTTTRTPHVGPGDVAVLIDDVVSVVADKAVIADALTKVAMIDVALANDILAQHGGAVVSKIAEAAA